MHGSALYHPGTWSSAGRQTAAAGDITNNTTTAACLALIMVMLAFAFVTNYSGMSTTLALGLSTATSMMSGSAVIAQ